mmetsp:Transcript_17682/g.35395  ORF Transcript_17682/g.35395 Transcript_17682/m.35395 type:complete len:276 (+) Transcript_17682:170-997(+)
MIHNHLSYDDADNNSVDSNYDIEIPTITTTGSVDALVTSATTTSLDSIKYDAATIKAEFKTYQKILPHPDKLLQEQHSFTYLRNKIEESEIDMPRFLKYKFEGGIKPHIALCCLLLGEYEAELQKQREQRKKNKKRKKQKYDKHLWGIFPFLVKVISFGYLHNQLNNPADYIRDQFFRVAHVIPTNVVPSDVLRKKIKDKGLPVPNYFLDPDDPRQLPPHIALLVMLQDGEMESRKLDSFLNRGVFFVCVDIFVVADSVGSYWGSWCNLGRCRSC